MKTSPRPFSTLESGLRDETMFVVSSLYALFPFSTLESGLRDETEPAPQPKPEPTPFSTLESGLRDETTLLLQLQSLEILLSVPSNRAYAMKLGLDCAWPTGRGAFSTLESGLRDETRLRLFVHLQVIRLSVPSNRAYAMKPVILHQNAHRTPLSVPSNRAYAMKLAFRVRRAVGHGTFSTLESGLRDETRVYRVNANRLFTFSTLESGLRDETLLARCA